VTLPVRTQTRPELALSNLALQLEADQQEEDRHQTIVDPQEQRLGNLERAHLNGNRCVEQSRVEMGEGG
jgi:hypothetical protein